MRDFLHYTLNKNGYHATLYMGGKHEFYWHNIY